MAPLKKRGYSRDFTPRTEERHRLFVDRVPATLFKAVTGKAARLGVSMRALILFLLKEWLTRDDDASRIEKDEA